MDGVYDVVGLATVSPLRENPPGPRPLRSLEHPDGLPKKSLTADEMAQLDGANALFDFTAEVVKEQRKLGRPWWIENPDHREKMDLWKTTPIKKVVNTANVDKARFDQCTFGAEVTKPTILASYMMDLSKIHGRNCQHPVKTFKKEDGSEYRAKHESLVQRWRQKEDGARERASKALGEYPPALCKAIARATYFVETDRAVKLRDMHAEKLP